MEALATSSVNLFEQRLEMLDTVSKTFPKPAALIQPVKSARRKTSRSASSRRQYEKRKAAGLCVYFGCSAKPRSNRQYCPEHLQRMLKRHQKLVNAREKKGLCTYCGERPQFWGRRCIICRRAKAENPLPFGARRALKLYREAERQFERELLEAEGRFGIRKLLATGAVTGDYAKALRLYAALDRGGFRTYDQVGKVMRLTKERIRQLLKPAKILLAETLGNDVPWKAVRGGADHDFLRRAYKRRSKSDRTGRNAFRSTKSKSRHER